MEDHGAPTVGVGTQEGKEERTRKKEANMRSCRTAQSGCGQTGLAWVHLSARKGGEGRHASHRLPGTDRDHAHLFAAGAGLPASQSLPLSPA